jgi:hypothetical protein
MACKNIQFNSTAKAITSTCPLCVCKVANLVLNGGNIKSSDTQFHHHDQFCVITPLHSWHTPIWNVCATLLKWGTVNSLPSQTDLHNQPLICILPSSPWDIMNCTQRKMTTVSIINTVSTLWWCEWACMLVKVGKSRTGQCFGCAYIPPYNKNSAYSW